MTLTAFLLAPLVALFFWPWLMLAREKKALEKTSEFSIEKNGRINNKAKVKRDKIGALECC